MDAPWRGETTGWAAVLKAARANGLQTNLEMVSTERSKVRAFGVSCLPHLDLLIVNDYEIGCVAGIETRDANGAVPRLVEEALRTAVAMGPVKIAVAHFPEGAIAVTAEGARFASGSVAMPPSAIAGVNGAGDAFAAGMLYGWHEGWGIEKSLRLGHATRRLRCARRPRRRPLRPSPSVSRSRISTALGRSPLDAATGSRETRRIFSAELRRLAVYPHKILFIRHGETDHNAEGRLQGQRDVPLNPRGREQASAVGRSLLKLRREEIARLDAAGAFVASPLMRAREHDGARAHRDAVGARRFQAGCAIDGDRLRAMGGPDLAGGSCARSRGA